MTRPELHALVDIVMDAREKGHNLHLKISGEANVYLSEHFDLWSSLYPTFSDFTKAVQEYIKTLETK